MPHISNAHYLMMQSRYNHDVACHLALPASKGEMITSGELAEKLDGTARGWGDALGGIAIRCHDAGLPLLHVLVVNAATRMPSADAVLYNDLGLNSPDDIRAQQQLCVDRDWRKTSLLSQSSIPD